MILSLKLPLAGDQQPSATVHRVLAAPGAELRPGVPLLEVRVEFSAAKAQDCPPVVYLRLVSTERAHLRTCTVAAGAPLGAGAVFGLATTTPDESCEGAPARALRTTSVAIQIDPLAG